MKKRMAAFLLTAVMTVALTAGLSRRKPARKTGQRLPERKPARKTGQRLSERKPSRKPGQRLPERKPARKEPQGKSGRQHRQRLRKQRLTVLP